MTPSPPQNPYADKEEGMMPKLKPVWGESLKSIAQTSAAAEAMTSRDELGEHMVIWRKFGRSWRLGIWAGEWVGPENRHYTFLGLTKRGIRRRIRKELERWDRKWR